MIYPEPFDRVFNAYVILIANRCWPNGYRITDGPGPQSLEELQETFERDGTITVSSRYSENTIWGNPEVNHAFRAWHDYWHLKKHLPFTLEGEEKAALFQKQDLADYVPSAFILRKWQDYIDAEIIGQALYYEMHRRFPSDQRAFVRDYLDAPSKARQYSVLTGYY